MLIIEEWMEIEKTKKGGIGNCIFPSIQFREKFTGKLGALVHFSQNALFRQMQFIHWDRNALFTMQSWNDAGKLGVCVLFNERFTKCATTAFLGGIWCNSTFMMQCNARPLLLVQFIAGGWVCVCRKRERREKATNLITMRCTSLSIQFTDWLKPAKILFAAHCLDLFGGGKDLWDGLYQNENGQIWFA